MSKALLAALGAAVLLVAPPALADARSEANKALVLKFYDLALNQKDEAALDYLGDRYIQHNPAVPDGPEGLRNLIRMLKTQFPNSRNEVKRAAAEDDLVWLHVHSTRERGQLGRAIVDIFRVEDGKVVEHWDVIQDVPEKAANANTMF